MVRWFAGLGLVAGLSLGSVAVAEDYMHVRAEDYNRAVVLEANGPAEAPAGIVVHWGSKAGELTASVTNTGAHVVIIDWNRSAFVSAAGVSTGVVPGSTIRKQVGDVLPPSVVPPGASVIESIIRRDQITPDSAGPVGIAGDEGKTVTLLLSLETGGQEAWLRQAFRVSIDRAHLEEIERTRQAAADQRERALMLQGVVYHEQKARKRAIGAGVAAGVSLVGIAVGLGQSDPTTKTGLLAFYVPAAAVSGGLTFYFVDKMGKLHVEAVGLDPEHEGRH